MVSDRFGLRDLDIDALRRKDGIKWAYPGTDHAIWVADMDFPVAPEVSDRLSNLIARQEFGYPNWGRPQRWSPAAERFAERMAERFGWSPALDRVFDLDDVIQGVRIAVHHLSAPGEAFVLHTPAYHPFLATGSQLDRPIVEVPAVRTEDGFAFDYDELEQRLKAPDTPPTRLWILCHPQNPLGHVFDRAELERIAEIALRHGLVVISDEVHADIRFTKTPHVPFASLSPEIADRTVTVTSASKAFNLAGLRWAVMHVGHQPMLDALAGLPDHYLGTPNRMAVEAAVAAWTDGDDWLAAVLEVLDENRHELTKLLDANLPGAMYHPPDATYLAWVDVSNCGLGGDPYESFRSRGVEVSNGPEFGTGGEGHVRINLATSPAILAAAVQAMSSNQE